MFSVSFSFVVVDVVVVGCEVCSSSFLGDDSDVIRVKEELENLSLRADLSKGFGRSESGE